MAILYKKCNRSIIFTRMSVWTVLDVSHFRRNVAVVSTEGSGAMYVGDRCSIVTFAAFSAIAGTIVTAVACRSSQEWPRTGRAKAHGQDFGLHDLGLTPEPITTISLPL